MNPSSALSPSVNSHSSLLVPTHPFLSLPKPITLTHSFNPKPTHPCLSLPKPSNRNWWSGCNQLCLVQLPGFFSVLATGPLNTIPWVLLGSEPKSLYILYEEESHCLPERAGHRKFLSNFRSTLQREQLLNLYESRDKVVHD